MRYGKARSAFQPEEKEHAKGFNRQWQGKGDMREREKTVDNYIGSASEKGFFKTKTIVQNNNKMLCLICGMLQARRMEAGKHTHLMRSILHRHTSYNHKHVCCCLKAKLGGGRRGKKTHRRETGDRVLVISVPASQTSVSAVLSSSHRTQLLRKFAPPSLIQKHSFKKL